MDKKTLVILIVSFAVLALLFVGITIDLVLLYRRRKKQSQLEKTIHQQKINELMQRHEMQSVSALLKGQDSERKRIAQELHDSLGSLLFTAKLHYAQLEKDIASLKEKQEGAYHQVTQLLDEAVDEVRRISHDLYEGTLVKFGYETAVNQLIHAIESTNAVKITFDMGGVKNEHFTSIQKDLYRITQELLSNTLKHAEAESISIQLQMSDKEFIFDYKDDGIGFDTVEKKSEGIGFQNMKARADAMGGEITFDHAKGQGFSCRLIIEDNEE